MEADRRETGQSRTRYPGLKRERSLQDIDKVHNTCSLFKNYRKISRRTSRPSGGSYRSWTSCQRTARPRQQHLRPCPSSSWSPHHGGGLQEELLNNKHLLTITALCQGAQRRDLVRSPPPTICICICIFFTSELMSTTGAITPTYISPSPRTARAAFLSQTTSSASNASTTSRGRPGRTSSQVLETDFPSEPSRKPPSSSTSPGPSVPSSQTNGHSPSHVLSNGTKSPVYSSSSKTSSFSSSTVKERSSSQTRGVEGLKSCLKSESRSSSATRWDFFEHIMPIYWHVLGVS